MGGLGSTVYQYESFWYSKTFVTKGASDKELLGMRSLLFFVLDSRIHSVINLCSNLKHTSGLYCPARQDEGAEVASVH